MKFTEECVMCMKKHVLVKKKKKKKKKLTNKLNMGLPLRSQIEKTVHGRKTDSPVKKLQA